MRWNRASLSAALKKSFAGKSSGFSLIELMVVIVIFGIIVGASVTNWVSFMQYQDMRRAALGLHKDLIALKAKALEDSAVYTVTVNNSSYTVSGDNQNRTVAFPNNLAVVPDAGWSAGIIISPSGLDAFTAGTITITRGAAGGKTFLIEKAANEINPRISYSGNGGAPWKKI